MQLSTKQQILQLADAITALLDKRSYRPAFDEDEMLYIIKKETAAGKYNKNLVKTFFDHYDEIMQRVKTNVEEILATYRRLNQQYLRVSGKLKEQ